MNFAAAVFMVSILSTQAATGLPVPDTTNCYLPIEGGWSLRISGRDIVSAALPESTIGVVQDNSRLHRRPLYPPADRSLIWNEDERVKLQRCGFRPLVLAYMEPRFLFDFHSAGGLLGHLRVGLVGKENSKWLHEWSEIDVQYIDGRMDYRLADPAFPGISVQLSAAPLAGSAGMVLQISASGAEGYELVWAYGGASAYFTNYAMNAPEFSFSPEQCAKDVLTVDSNGFLLERDFDEDDVYTKEIFAASRYLPEWTAQVRAGSDCQGRTGLGDPSAFLLSPSTLLAATEWRQETRTQIGRIAVEAAKIAANDFQAFVVVGMGGNIVDAIGDPRAAMDAALARNNGIASRVVTRTPDPYLDAAMRMMAFATEGTWGDTAILHGAWSWRFAYLGWRGWYGSMCYGWPERIRRSIENHTTLGVITEGPDAGALGSLLEYSPGVYYNMNEVFLDQVRQYYEYTDDVNLMRQIFPVLQGILAWEDRRLQPGGAGLYENSLNTWISDSHWYIGGQCTQASAYMLAANRFVGDLAERLGEDAAPYRQRAERIRAAIQETLWMPEKGVFAEYRDTRGNRMLHSEPELPTIYHSAEFGAADGSQIAQMLHWVDSNLKHETTPGGGVLVWSSNWYPNHARSYTHSTHELAYAEELNLALTNYLAGRADAAYSIIRGVMCGIYNGPTPGGLSCHTFVDGRQRANDEFSDAISMWGRAVVEGLFGIVPNRPRGYVTLSPQFPREWTEASIASPALSYQWLREGEMVSIEWSSPVETSIHLRLPIPANRVHEATVNDRTTTGSIEPGFAGVNWLLVETPSSRSGTIRVTYTPESVEAVPTAPQIEPSQPSRAQWTPPGPKARVLAHWDLVDLSSVFNSKVTDVLSRVTEEAVPPEMPASQVGFGYWKDHLLQYHGSRNQAISDAAWRAKVGDDEIAWTTDGIPFKTSKKGPNIGVVTRAGGFPETLSIPVNAKGKALYLMLSGMTFPAQSHVVNLRITLHYADGESVVRDLVNPFDIGDCWSTWCGRYHDSAVNGFENIGGRTGPAGSIEVDDLTQPVALDTEAQLLRMDLREGVKLETITMEAYANDIIFGIMGASIYR
ncbi:MAG: hypothetical protein AMXMBFR82_26290 [Candidatus Hydrogenedentota bacterium]